MSRRSLVPRIAAQERGGRRLTMGPARQYSEAPVRAGAGPRRVFALEPGTAMTLPDRYTMGSWPTIGPGSAAVPITDDQQWQVTTTLDVSEQALYTGAEQLGIVTARGLPDWTPDPTWEVVATGSDGTEYVRYWVLRRTQPAVTSSSFTTPVGTYSASGGAGTYAGARFLSWWFAGMSGGRWHVTEKGSGASSPVTFTAADPVDTFRLQLFPSTGFSVDWSGTAPPGFPLTRFGYLGGETAHHTDLLSSGSTWPDPRPRFAAPFVEGAYSAVTGGRWIELHIAYRDLA